MPRLLHAKPKKFCFYTSTPTPTHHAMSVVSKGLEGIVAAETRLPEVKGPKASFLLWLRHQRTRQTPATRSCTRFTKQAAHRRSSTNSPPPSAPSVTATGVIQFLKTAPKTA